MSTYYAKGKYLCEVIEQGVGAAATGTPQFVLRVKVLERFISQDEREPLTVQYERTCYNAITDKTIQYLIKKLAAIGYTHGSLRFLDPATPGYQDFRGQAIVMMCNHEPNRETGEDREKWEIAWGGSESESLELRPVDPNKMRQLDVLFGAALKEKPAAKTSAPQARARQSAPPPPPPTRNDAPSDDDVPF